MPKLAITDGHKRSRTAPAQDMAVETADDRRQILKPNFVVAWHP